MSFAARLFVFVALSFFVIAPSSFAHGWRIHLQVQKPIGSPRPGFLDARFSKLAVSYAPYSVLGACRRLISEINSSTAFIEHAPILAALFPEQRDIFQQEQIEAVDERIAHQAEYNALAYSINTEVFKGFNWRTAEQDEGYQMSFDLTDEELKLHEIKDRIDISVELRGLFGDPQLKGLWSVPLKNGDWTSPSDVQVNYFGAEARIRLERIR